MLEFIVFSLAAALVIYAVLGGADFGAGIWEIFSRRNRRAHEDLIATALAPVWEANHVWLIIALVIAFTAFPAVFQAICVSFHIPLLVALVGITLRGCAFTFRHYDALQDAKARRYYTIFFELGSLLTPFVLGMIVGGIAFASLPAAPTDFASAYLWPWLNLPAAAVGLFAVVVFAYVAAVFLTGETTDASLQKELQQRANWSAAAAVVAGLLVFLASERSPAPLLQAFLGHPLSIACAAGATLLFVPIHGLLRRANAQWARFLVAGQIGLVLIGWGVQHYPLVVRRDGLAPLTFVGSAAPLATLRQLAYALVIGGAIMLPSLAWLLFVYKKPFGSGPKGDSSVLKNH